jgi:hypothetical protein
VRGGELHHVGQKPQGGFDGKKDFVLRLHFLEDVRLYGPAERGHNAGTKTPSGRRDVHGEDDGRRAVDRHRNREMPGVQREPGVKPLHVLDRIDRHAPFAYLAEHSVSVAVQAVQSRPVERGAETEAFLVSREVVESSVGILGQAQSGEEPRRLFDWAMGDG